jgi:hypothetical protein
LNDVLLSAPFMRFELQDDSKFWIWGDVKDDSRDIFKGEVKR